MKSREQIRNEANARSKAFREKGLCATCGEPATHGVCCERHWNYFRDRNIKERENIFNHYGWKCACCGESNPKFLTIDHIDNNGAVHRATSFTNKNSKHVAGVIMYRWIRKHGYPDNFQTLCFNCNCGKQRNDGTCPHKTVFKTNNQ